MVSLKETEEYVCVLKQSHETGRTVLCFEQKYIYIYLNAKYLDQYIFYINVLVNLKLGLGWSPPEPKWLLVGKKKRKNEKLSVVEINYIPSKNLSFSRTKTKICSCVESQNPVKVHIHP